MGTVVLTYGATNVKPTQKDQPLLSSKRMPHFEIYKRSWNEQKIWSWVPNEIETENDCAGEDQQQFT
jgi:hypothetical protein